MPIRLAIYIGYYAINLLFAHDPLAMLLTAPAMVIVVWQITQIDDQYFTLWDMVHFLMYLYFVIEPLQMIDHGRIGIDGPVSQAVYSNRDITIAMAIATLFYGIVAAMTAVARRLPGTIVFYRIDNKHALTVLALIYLAFAAYVYLCGGLANVLSSRWERHDALQGTGSDALAGFLAISIGILSGAVFTLASQVRLKLNFTAFLFAIACIPLAICLNPLNTSRFSMISVYVPLLFMLMRGRVRALYVYGVAMFGVVVVMPILSVTTRFGLAGIANHDLSTAGILSLPLDAFDILVECVRYVGIHGFDGGTRLVADLVTYFPRSVWPGKPTLGAIDVGQGLVDVGFFGTSNVSQIAAADGYMDFGFAGVVVVSLVVGFYLTRVFIRRQVIVNGHPLIAYAFIAGSPILLRGPIAAVVSTFLFQALTILALRMAFGRRLPIGGEWRTSGIGVAPAGAPVRSRPSPPGRRSRPIPAR